MGEARLIARDRADLLGEGPLWSARENALYWVDISGRRLNRIRFAENHIESWSMPDRIGWVIERERGGLVAGIGCRVAVLSLDPFMIDYIADPEPDRVGNRMNDAKADAAGCLWMGTMPIDGLSPTGAFYRLAPDHGVTRADDGYRIANGPAIGDDALFHTDTGIDTIYRFPLNTDGSLGRRETFIVFEPGWGHPDGMTLDAEGGLWVACWGSGCVRRFTPDGKLDRMIGLPASQVSSVTFAGEGLDRMFVTSAAEGVAEPQGGGLFEIEPGVRGRPTCMFAG